MLLLSAAVLLLSLLSHGYILPESEIYALKALYDSTDGPNWSWDDESAGEIWNFTGNISLIDPCNWQGVDCTCTPSRDHYFYNSYFFYDFYYDDDDSALTESCNIRKIYLDYYDLDGVLPDEFYNSLPHLTHLHLNGNYLYSTISASISNLTSLASLHLAYNYFEGTLDDVSLLVNLDTLILYNNLFHGNTSVMERMAKLVYLDLGYNYLDEGETGNIITNFTTNLQILWLNSNLFGGVLDYFVPRLTELTALSVHRNHFEGNIDSVSNLSHLKLLNLYRNSFTGDLSALTDLYELQSIKIYYCMFSGELEPLSQLYNLVTFDAESNYLAGSIEPLRNLNNLRKLHLSANYFSVQSLEPVAKLTNLNHVGLWNSNGFGFTGSVDIFRNMLDMEYLDCDLNYLTGDISALGDLIHADNLYFSDNLLSGTLDALSALTALERLDVGNNLLYGTIDALGDIHTLQYLRLSSNNFHGTLPSAMALSEVLTYLNIANNHFEGTVPPLQSLTYLTGLFVAHNMLSGPLDFISPSPSSPFQLLSIIDIHDNRFTGHVPNSWFQMESITNIIASVNCLKISFSSDICDASNLQALLLDGLHSNPACRYKYSFTIVDEIYYSPEVVSNVPSCIYELPSIKTLHMSGNGIKSRLPTNVRLSENLTELVLSNNMISGPIPTSFQRHHYDILDLSNNKITGLLSDELIVTDTFSVHTNRLSGNIPHALYATLTVNMLSGNIYSCDSKEVVRLHDEQVGTNYTCGSDAFTYVGIVCSVIFFVVITLFVLSHVPAEKVSIASLHFVITSLRNKRIQLEGECNISEELDSGNVEISISKDIHYFMHVTEDVKKFAAILTVIIVLIYLPIYCALSAYYGRYTLAYAWTASAAYLSGVAPGAILFICYLLMVIIPGALYGDQMMSVIVNSSKSIVENVFRDNVVVSRRVNARRTVSNSLDAHKVSQVNYSESAATSSRGIYTSDSTRRIHSDGLLHGSSSDKRPSKNVEIKRKQFVTLAVIALVNFIVVIFINGLYVYLTLSLSSVAETLIEFLMGAFKSVWTSTFLLRLIEYAGKHGYLPDTGANKNKSRHLNFLTVVVILNNILLPCLALAVVSPDCFYNRLFALREMHSNYDYEICRVYDDYSIGSTSCILHYKEVGVATITYKPPYSYTYQCSSVLVAAYIPVFIYSAIFTGFINPLFDIATTRIVTYAEKYPSEFTTALLKCSKRLKLFAEYIFDSELGDDVFDQTNFIITINSSISIMVRIPFSFTSLISHSTSYVGDFWCCISVSRLCQLRLHRGSLRLPAVSDRQIHP